MVILSRNLTDGIISFHGGKRIVFGAGAVTLSERVNLWRGQKKISPKKKFLKFSERIIKMATMKKTFYVQNGIGKAKYCLSYHDGVSTHKDGSPFFALAIFKNKKKLNEKIKELRLNGYAER